MLTQHFLVFPNLKKVVILIFILVNFYGSFTYSQDKNWKDEFKIGISFENYGPQKPDWWGRYICWGGGEYMEYISWKEEGIQGDFYDKKTIPLLLLEYKFSQLDSISFKYPVKNYEDTMKIMIPDLVEQYDDVGNFIGTCDWVETNRLKIQPIILNYLKYLKKGSSPYVGFGISLNKIKMTLYRGTKGLQPEDIYSTGSFSQWRNGYEFVGGYELKIRENISVDAGIKYQKIDKIEGKAKMYWSTGEVEEREIYDSKIDNYVFSLRIKYTFK